MSKKKRKHKNKLKINCFYRVLDGSPTGHPGKIYKIDYGQNTFYALVTGSMTFEELKTKGTRKGYVILSESIDSIVEVSLLKKRPFIGNRDDFGDKEYVDMQFSEKDDCIILEVQTRRPIYGKNYKKTKRKPQYTGHTD